MNGKIESGNMETVQKAVKAATGEKIKCTWPNCTKSASGAHDLEVSNEKHAVARLPFCWYHIAIVMGGHFTCYKEEAEDPKILFEFRMQGPFGEVEIVEQVLGAIEIAKVKAKE